MSSVTTALESLVFTLVPTSRADQRLVQDLISRCQDILSRRKVHRIDQDISQPADTIRPRLAAKSPGGIGPLKFTNLVSRLDKQPTILRKAEILLFLSSLTFPGRPKSPVGSIFRPFDMSSTSKGKHVFREASIPTSTPNAAGKSKATLLKEYRQLRGHPPVPEVLLLRDAIYLLQGISGKYVQFSDDVEDNKIVFSDDPSHIISASTKVLIHRLAELGYLYRRVDGFVRERESVNAIGMIEQSLCHYLQSQLNDYYRLIAVLETQLASGTNELPPEGSAAGELRNESGLSLKRLEVWVNEWRLRMRMMSVCVEGAKEAHGGALVNLIHSYTENGDPFVRSFTHELLEEVSRPFFTTLHKWLFSGELYDPFSEFFVSVDTSIGPNHYSHPSSLPGGIVELAPDHGLSGAIGDGDEFLNKDAGIKLWESKYQFRKTMLPLFVGEASGKKIFSTGRSLNFIRYSCQDSEWVLTREKMNAFHGSLQYSDISGLERSIDSAYRLASNRLFEVFIEKFKLLDHLSALRNYLLLGYGDFADQLMETLGPSLSRSANTLYRHNLTATLESAIRSSNAQHDPPDVLRQLDARMLEYSHGEIGWDVFTLEYKVEAPIDTVLDSLALEDYLKLFRHLWQMKRIEKTLDRGWMRITGGAKTFIRVPELEPEWHKVRLQTAEMVHFIRQLEAFCRLEVIECSWKILIDFLDKKEGDLDSLIEAHRSYLDRVKKKIFLLNHKSKSNKEELVLNMVKDQFSVILSYREATDNFYNFTLSEAARRDQLADTARGVFTGNPAEPQDPTELITRLREYGTNFKEKLHTIVQLLQAHPDLDCRFLAIRLSFSDYYKRR
ncbi:gamma-tubulin complex, DGRIP91/SPC98 component [Ephemerocybe angulata]|uniref:Gamma-tubulin complex, DGRIP91/SPC98 component n=1 Tax=Ephemerocybe angulata TaxID=980116 RepID=A0A8H6MBH7_9AGAR|nr:gamma-tubulin complex, DGRIP91/SPC98 component [Tulosesus angulatus]